MVNQIFKILCESVKICCVRRWAFIVDTNNTTEFKYPSVDPTRCQLMENTPDLDVGIFRSGSSVGGVSRLKFFGSSESTFVFSCLGLWFGLSALGLYDIVTPLPRRIKLFINKVLE